MTLKSGGFSSAPVFGFSMKRTCVRQTRKLDLSTDRGYPEDAGDRRYCPAGPDRRFQAEIMIKDDINQYDDASPVRRKMDIVLPDSRGPQVAYQKYTFLAAVAFGLAAIGMGFIVSCAVMVIYGINSLGSEQKGLLRLMEDGVRFVPAVREWLSPGLSDVLDDHRRPDYRDRLEITARTQSAPDSGGRLQTVVTVVNRGGEIVSLLSLRVAVLSSSGRIVAESTEFAATPIAGRGYWRGLLTPGSTRHFSCSYAGELRTESLDRSTTEVEITDVRIWDPDSQASPLESETGEAVG